jgi:hypothetical protein
MKERVNVLSYKQKGELISIGDEVIETIKKDDNDYTDLSQFVKDVQAFCTENMGKQIEVNFTIKCVE